MPNTPQRQARRRNLDGGTKVSEEWLVADTLTIDPTYQRPVRPSTVRMIAENFDPDAIGVLYISRRDDDSQVILDGQQRWTAITGPMGWADQKVPCHVYHGLSHQEEAALWVEFNQNRTKPRPLELFTAKLAAGDQETIELDRVTKSVGLHFGSGQQRGVIQAVDTCRQILKGGGPGTLKLTLSACKHAWQGQVPGPYQGPILKVLGVLISRYRAHLDMDRLIKVLAKVDPNALLSRARMIKSDVGGDPTQVLGQQIIARYNKSTRREADRLPEWEERNSRSFWRPVGEVNNVVSDAA